MKHLGLIIICIASISATLSINYYASNIENTYFSRSSNLYSLSYLSFFGTALISTLTLINRFLRTSTSESGEYQQESKALSIPIWLLKVITAFGLALALYLYIVLAPTS